MDLKKVLVLGESLPAESMAFLFKEHEQFDLIGQTKTLSEAEHLLREHQVDVLVLVENGRGVNCHLGEMLTKHPELPIVRANIEVDKVQVITSRCLGTRLDEFIQIISSAVVKGLD